jgi:hypothetical protein
VAEAGLDQLLGDLAKIALGVLGGGASGWWTGRRGAREAIKKSRQDDYRAEIDATDEFMIGALTSLRVHEETGPGSGPDPGTRRLKDEQLVGTDLWEKWLKTMVELAPRGGHLSHDEKEAVGLLEKRISTQLGTQRELVRSGNAPVREGPNDEIRRLYGRSIDLI